MTMGIFVCSHCHKPVDSNEPVKVYSEGGGWWYFHNNATCYSRWKLARIRAEAERIERYLAEYPDDRLGNGG